MQVNRIDYDQLALNAGPGDAIKVFNENADIFNDKQYWKNLGEAYMMQNYKRIPYTLYKKLFTASRENRNFLMNKTEQEFLRKLPVEIVIYRGGSKSEEKMKSYGVSWTLEKTIAQSFADVKTIRDDKEMIVIQKTIPKKDAIAYFNRRKEAEIIYIS
jgi:hypothetical protein